MANEMTVPLLPCASIDEIEAFYRVLGFGTTYHQRKPNPYVALQREDLRLNFFEIAGFDPEQSYGSCLVITSDVAELHRAFSAGMRAAYGKVLVSGVPRMTRPRARKNADGVSGFCVIDPGGNWIRVFPAPAASPAPASSPVSSPASSPVSSPVSSPASERVAAAGRVAAALANAVVLADSKGDVRQAVRVLDSALARPEADDDPVTHVEVLVYRAELAMVLQDRETATDMLARAERIALDADETGRAASALENAADLRVALG
ncbi:VOC family protein [Catenuloplanes atrovinosus]|uniref:VOC family protein n=1 Tax=Catenuloplanes atrovinosus TaxID=137266 RepID=A0AAE4CEI3_9ACTN|nr:VOC family protein [Catenuloplanes atrovinosus]MDR7281173.1 hypothetical protein [Catenuloplanes atrovinosus]